MADVDLEGQFPKNPEEPEGGRFQGFHGMEFYVSNAKQIADYYCARFGFKPVAHKGLTTGSRDFATRVIRQGRINFIFTSPLNPQSMEDDHAKWVAQRGDSVHDVSFRCTNVPDMWQKAVDRGAKGVMSPNVLDDNDGKGSVTIAKLETYGGVLHTLVDDTNYTGTYMPGYADVTEDDPLFELLPNVGLEFIDHCVGNQPENKMLEAAQWYFDHLDFHRFWSVDDKQMHTEFSALRSMVMADWHETIKMPLNEPAEAKKKSQIQEYVEYHGGAGVQHIALNTPDILTAVASLRARGMKFLRIPDTYYAGLRERLEAAEFNWSVEEDLQKIQELNILVDFDEQGYLLQIFTEPLEDRPTLFVEIIQRRGNQGFGVGNFKSLFEAIERTQEERGNLV